MSYYDFLALPPATAAEMRAAFAAESARIPVAGRLILAHSRLRCAGKRATCPEIWQAVQGAVIQGDIFAEAPA